MNNWSKRWRKFWALPGGGKWLFVQVLFLLVLVKLLLRILPFKTFKKVFNWGMTLPAGSQNNAVEVTSIVTKISGSVPLGFTCLPQAVVTRFLLRSYSGVALIFGVQTSGGSFESHAWVEHHGSIIMGDLPDSTFKPLWKW